MSKDLKMPFRMFQRPLRGALSLISAVAIATFVIVPLGSQAAFAIPDGPTNDVAPALSAPVAQVNVPITTDNGSWTTSGGVINYAYQWQFCDQDGNGCSDIGGETTNSVAVGAGSIGGTVKAEIFATDDNGTVEHDSNLVQVQDTPANTVAPVISGVPSDGQTLSVDNGTFTGGYLTYSYRWQRCNASGVSCSNIASATDNTYIVTGTDIGHKLRAIVTAQNDIDSASKPSAVTTAVAAVPPANVAPVTITGVAKNGNTLTEHDGSWTGTAPITFTYQWRLCNNAGAACSDIGGQTASTYTVQASDETHTIRVVVTAHGSGTDAATSDPTAVVTTNPPVNTVIPNVDGSTADGNQLTTDNGTWTGLTPFTYTYRWLRCDVNGANCVAIGGETTNAYTLTSDDINHTIRSEVVAHNDDGDGSAAQSHASDEVTSLAPGPQGLVSIDGTTERGNTLSVNNPPWYGSQPINFTYQWRSCDANGTNCVDIEGATDSTYDLGVGDIGSRLRVVVTASNSGGTASSVSFPSNQITASVPDAPGNVEATLGSHQISVAFDPPFDGGSSIIGYDADCVSSNGGVENDNIGSGSPIVVSGLDNGKDYTCTVTATNAIGDSSASGPSNAVTPADVPDQPDAPDVTFGNGQITVDIAPPADNGSQITRYDAFCEANGDINTLKTAFVTGTPATPEVVVTGVTNGLTYLCSAAATNSVGGSLISANSDPVTPATVPDAPQSVTATAHNHSIHLTFNAPGFDGGHDITDYTASCTSSNGGASNDNDANATAIDVGALTNGKLYTCTVVATNDVGDSAASSASNQVTTPVAPGAPTIGTATPHAASIAVGFTPPVSDGGATITSYTATCTGGLTGSGGSSPITVNGLTNGSSYTCTVHATNEVGSSPESAASNAATPKDVPGAPTGATITRHGSGGGAFDVAFVAPVSNGGDTISGYTAVCTSNNGGVQGQHSAGSSPITVTGLTNGKTYTCVVFATNSIGDGANSVASNSLTPATNPDAPTIGAVDPGDASLTVHFSHPANDGGTNITGYTASCSLVGGGGTQTNAGGFAVTQIVVSSLTNGSAYTCKVKATNAVGDSSFSADSDQATPATVPSAPAKPTVTNPSAGTIRVTFVAPATGGDPITSYEADCTSSNGGTFGSNTGASSPIDVSSLTKSKSYTCTVTATNGVGAGSASPASDAQVVAATVPSAPVIDSVARHGSQTVRVAFEAPLDGGGSALVGGGHSYRATCGAQHQDGDSSPIDVTGLVNGTPVTCTVHATNGVGSSSESAASNSITPATTPSAPTIDGVSRDGTSGNIEVDFTPGSDGGDAVTGFTATCTSADLGANTPEFNTGDSSPIIVSGVTLGDTYTCTVHATNGVGASAESAASDPVVPAVVPDAPTLTGISNGDHSITVTFSDNGNGSDPITGHTASCSSSDGGAPGNQSGASPITIAGLTLHKHYQCSVVATNGVGNSDPSDLSNSEVVPGLPDAPTGVSAQRGDATIRVSFTELNTDDTPPSNNDSPLDGYRATCTSSDGGAANDVFDSGSPIDVTGLTNGKHYTCTVHATNDVGDGAESSASNQVVPDVVPNAPTINSVDNTADGPNAVHVVFTPGVDNGTAVTNFAVTCTSSDGGTTRSNNGNSSPINVTGLTNNKTYTCRVVATNGAGDSLASAASSSFKAADAPSAPTVDGVSRHGTAGGALDVSYTNGSDNGSPITDDTVHCTSNDGGAPGVNDGLTDPITVSGLTDGKTYTCTVTATNAIDDSTASDPSDPIVSASIPDQVDQPTLGVNVDDTRAIDVTFTELAGAGTGGIAVNSYAADCTSNDGGQEGSNSGSGSPITVAGLDKGHHYTCTVTATNDVGGGLASDASDPLLIPITAPDQPAQPTAVRDGSGTLLVSWTAPYDGGDAITGFSVNCTSSDGGASGSQVALGSATSIDVAGLDNGKHYTCTVLATNGHGDSPQSSPSASVLVAAAPAAPTIGTATRTTGFGVDVTFNGNATNGSPVTSNTATCTSSNGGTTRTGSNGGAPIHVTNLSSGKSYTCTVDSTNIAGTSGESAASNSFVAASVPSPPSIDSATAGDSSIQVAFSGAVANGDAIDNYVVTCTSNDGGASNNNSGASSPITVSSLTNAKHYTCVVHAHNALGNGTDSAASNSVMPDVVPGAPTVTGVTRFSANSVHVAFTAGVDNGTAVTGFTATCSSGGGATKTGSGASSPIDVTGLTQGASYTCTVHATNQKGDSAESTASSSFTAAAVPSPPSIDSATAGDSSIQVAFSGAVANGDTIDNYVVTCTSNDGGASNNNSGAVSPITVSSLTNAKHYTCVVHAHNALGNGTDSAASDSVMPDVVPDAPAIDSVTPGDSSVSVAFTPGTDNGSAVTNFTASCSSGDDVNSPFTNDSSSSPIVVSGLTNGDAYTCTVVATNARGDSEASDPSDSATPDVVPDAPDAPTLTADDGSITATFSAPNNNGTAITDYTVDCVSSDGGTEMTNDDTSSPITVTGLTNGKTYTCTVFATNNAGNGDPSAASDSIVVGVAPANTVAPTVTGTAMQQRTLTAHNGTWTGVPSPSFAYQWRRCDKNGANCADITGATGSTRVLSLGDVDHKLRVVVTATNVEGSTPATSSATALVQTVPVSISGPYYYDGVHMRSAPAGSVGAATHGSTVWVVYPNGNLTGPHYAPGDGTLVGKHLAKPIVGIVATPSGKGYWMFASDGGVFAFGDAHFYGSTGGMKLNAPIVSMASTPSGHGYWLFGADGGVFTYGDAVYHGSTGGQNLTHPVVAMLATPSGHGYWLVTTDGRAIRFGDATNIGSVTSLHRTDIVGLVSTGAGYRFVTQSLALLTPS